MKDYIKEIHGRSRYYKTTGIALGCYMLASILVALYSEKLWFVWLFIPYGLLKALYGFPAWASAIVMNLIPFAMLGLVHIRYLIKRVIEKEHVENEKENSNSL